MLKHCVAILLASITVISSAQEQKAQRPWGRKNKNKFSFSSRFGDTYERPSSVLNCDSDANEKLITDATGDLERARVRNKFARRAKADLIASQEWYMGRIQRDRSIIYTIFDVANIGATAAAGAVGGPAAAKSFALTATAIAAIKSTVVTNFDGGAANSLVAKIQTSFANNAVLLEQNLNLNYSSYDLSTACSDIMALYDSGQKVSTGGTVPPRAVVPSGSAAPGAIAPLTDTVPKTMTPATPPPVTSSAPASPTTQGSSPPKP